ncbi:glycosyltransferase involved in cell wall biosynthesis [Humitalea rosea]|uniref:Glycosyltransferase involved in cell wall biosynthesis n=1 Tax=Humitalea rosea TaxID=990373 RepID=A0A2W7IKR2_9PROT|nr:glycosyltransferase family 4 protein [Humitalea rosea]PZW45875.1 glycosyltransferase involved in cell wall biosynthesis [Humitalea rosea]
MNQLHRLWRAIPREARRGALFGGMALLAPRPTRPAPAPSEPIILAGYLTAPTGLGEGARRMLAAMRAQGLAVHPADLTWAHRQGPRHAPPEVPRGPGTLILHVNGPMLPWALLALGRRAVAGKRVIAYWAWELPGLPADWARGFRFAHEIWAPSSFCAAAMRRPTGPPVRVVPHPLPEPICAPIGRAAFGLPEAAFISLCLFDAGSSLARKNPLGAIAAHERAFGDQPDRILVLKTHGTATAGPGWAEVAAAAAARPNIRVIDADLPRAEMWALMAAADVVVSLHRAEGFGFAIAEAMALGRPVVATDWSGNRDFMHGPGVHPVPARLIPARDPQATYDFPAMSWADPDLDAAAAILRRIAGTEGLRHPPPVAFPAPDYAVLLDLARTRLARPLPTGYQPTHETE